MSSMPGGEELDVPELNGIINQFIQPANKHLSDAGSGLTQCERRGLFQIQPALEDFPCWEVV